MRIALGKPCGNEILSAFDPSSAVRYNLAVNSSQSMSPKEEHKSLHRILGPWDGIAVTIGIVIGLGIFRTPGLVAQHLGSPDLVLLAWALGGLYALAASLTFAELSTLFPQAGGHYTYIQRAYGNYVGFLSGWTDSLSYIGATASIAVVFGEYLGLLAEYGAGGVKVVAASALLALAAINWIGLRWGSAAQNIFSLAKIVALSSVVIASFALGGGPSASASTLPAINAPGSAAQLIIAFGLAMQGVFWTYHGWAGVAKLSEEVRDPGRNLPRVLVGGVIGVIAIYLLINIAFLYVLPIDRIAASKLVAADVADELFGPRGGQIITALALVSIFGGLNANILQTPRIFFAMARDGLTFNLFTRVNSGGTPTAALFVTISVSVMLALTNSFESLLATTLFMAILNDLLAFLSVYIFRRRLPEAPRPYRAPGYPWLPLFSVAIASAFLLHILYGELSSLLVALKQIRQGLSLESFQGLLRSLPASILLVALSYPAYRLWLRFAAPGDRVGGMVEAAARREVL